MAKVYVLIQMLSDEMVPVAVHAYADIKRAIETFHNIMDEDDLERFDDPNSILAASSLDGDCAMSLMEVEVK